MNDDRQSERIPNEVLRSDTQSGREVVLFCKRATYVRHVPSENVQRQILLTFDACNKIRKVFDHVGRFLPYGSY